MTNDTNYIVTISFLPYFVPNLCHYLSLFTGFNDECEFRPITDSVAFYHSPQAGMQPANEMCSHNDRPIIGYINLNCTEIVVCFVNVYS